MTRKYPSKEKALRDGLRIVGRRDLAHSKGKLLDIEEIEVLEMDVIEFDEPVEDLTIIEFNNTDHKCSRLGSSRFHEGWDLWLIEPNGIPIRLGIKRTNDEGSKNFEKENELRRYNKALDALFAFGVDELSLQAVEGNPEPLREYRNEELCQVCFFHKRQRFTPTMPVKRDRDGVITEAGSFLWACGWCDNAITKVPEGPERIKIIKARRKRYKKLRRRERG